VGKSLVGNTIISFFTGAYNRKVVAFDTYCINDIFISIETLLYR